MPRVLGIAVALAALLFPASAGNDYMGEVPPEVQVGGWINKVDPQFGTRPVLEELRGQVVLIEFWSTT